MTDQRSAAQQVVCVLQQRSEIPPWVLAQGRENAVNLLAELVSAYEGEANHRRTYGEDGGWIRCAFDDGSTLTFITGPTPDDLGRYKVQWTLTD